MTPPRSKRQSLRLTSDIVEKSRKGWTDRAAN